jgi:hypothetical protein
VQRLDLGTVGTRDQHACQVARILPQPGCCAASDLNTSRQTNSSCFRFSKSAWEIELKYSPISFEDYWLASKAWERRGLSLGTARALVNAGFLTLEDLHKAHDFELAGIPRVGAKSLEILYALAHREMPITARRRKKRICRP